eukprot:UN28990
MLEAVEHMDMTTIKYKSSEIKTHRETEEMLHFEAITNPSPNLQARRLKILKKQNMENTRVFCPLFAVRLFYRSLCTFPALCRHWWKMVPRGVGVITTKLTKRDFSPMIISHHLDQNRAFQEQDDFSISVFGASNEIRAEYKQDDVSLGLIINYPNDYPFQNIKCHFSHHMGVEDKKTAADGY